MSAPLIASLGVFILDRCSGPDGYLTGDAVVQRSTGRIESRGLGSDFDTDKPSDKVKGTVGIIVKSLAVD